jgi:hypothetical protein
VFRGTALNYQVNVIVSNAVNSVSVAKKSNDAQVIATRSIQKFPCVSKMKREARAI